MRTLMLRLSCLALAFLTFGPVHAEDIGWPREVKTRDGGVIVIYQPQPESLEGNVLTTRTAVSVARGSSAPVFGAVWSTATLDIDKDERTAGAVTMTIDRVHFPDVEESRQDELRDLLEKEFADLEMTMSLDRLMTSLEASEREQSGEGLRSDPPQVIFSNQPALLVSIDGEPQLRAIAKTRLMRVVNTPFPIVFDPEKKTFYLYGSSVWFATGDLVHGSWRAIDAPPDAVADLFRGDERAEGAPTQPPAGQGVPPEKLRRTRIIVATVPSELIVSDGDPRWSPVVAGDLLALSNSDSKVFMEVDSRDYYVLLSGRWYRSKDLEDGPWVHVPPPELPEVFAKVPAGSTYADVRAHVPGTDEANDAVADAMIPQTAAVSRKEAKVEVAYDGKPQFDKIPGTKILLATNTASQVLKVEGVYWLCEQGVWYTSDSPHGPWVVADERPEGVDDIPASSPAYNVKYVYVYDSTPDYVYVGYLPGYLWSYPYYGTVVYGTGWYYRPYISPVCYYPHPWTWGFGATYSPWYGWGYGFSWSLGWASFSWGWGYGWGGWYHGYYPYYYGHPYPYGYAAGWRAGYWTGVHAGGWFGPGGYCPTTWTTRHPRPAPPGAHHGAVASASVRVPRSAGYNLYARSENPNFKALRPARQRPPSAPTSLASGRPGARTQDDPSVGRGTAGRGRVAAPPTAKRPEPVTTRPEPVVTPRSGNPNPSRVTAQPGRGRNNVYVDPSGNIYRFQDQKWQRRQQGRWQPVEGDPSEPGRSVSTPSGRVSPKAPAAPRSGAAPAPRNPSRPATPSRPGAAPQRPAPPAPGTTARPAPAPGTSARPAPAPGTSARPTPAPAPGDRFGNRAVPRGGSSLDSARSSRARGSARVDSYRGRGGSPGMSRAPSGGSRPSAGGGGRPGGSARPSGGSRPSGGRPHR